VRMIATPCHRRPASGGRRTIGPTTSRLGRAV